MEIRKVENDKAKYMDILLEADPDKDIVNKYLEYGDLYVGEKDGIPVCVCVITKYNEFRQWIGIADSKERYQLWAFIIIRVMKVIQKPEIVRFI